MPSEAARKALSLDANNSYARILASWLFSMGNKYEKAITEAKKAIMLNPNNPYAYWTIGGLLILTDRPDEAIGFLKKAIRINSIAHVWFLTMLGWAYRSAKEYEKVFPYKNKDEIKRNVEALREIGLPE